MNVGTQIARSAEIGAKVERLLRRRSDIAVKKYTEQVGSAVGAHDGAGDGKLPALLTGAVTPWSAWQYTVDAMQRSVLFWDTLRQRGDEFVASSINGLQPALHFESSMVLDGRGFERPVNYALL